eukprot:scaffold124137_cov33-Tisochrysis_lutea.AAC.5
MRTRPAALPLLSIPSRPEPENDSWPRPDGPVRTRNPGSMSAGEGDATAGALICSLGLGIEAPCSATSSGVCV